MEFKTPIYPIESWTITEKEFLQCVSETIYTTDLSEIQIKKENEP